MAYSLQGTIKGRKKQDPELRFCILLFFPLCDTLLVTGVAHHKAQSGEYHPIKLYLPKVPPRILYPANYPHILQSQILIIVRCSSAKSEILIIVRFSFAKFQILTKSLLLTKKFCNCKFFCQ